MDVPPAATIVIVDADRQEGFRPTATLSRHRYYHNGMAAHWIVGCCGWCEPQRRYVSAYRAIELQTPFYEPPSLELAGKWRALAPPEFRYCLKAWQLITHTPASPTYRRLKSHISNKERDLFGSFRPTEQVWLAWERTRSVARVLQAAAVVFQCPPSFTPSPENIRNVRSFFGRMEPESWHVAWEPRGVWPPELVRDICAEFGLLHCVDPFQSEAVFGDTLYWRLHGRDGYRYRYTDDDLRELYDKLVDRGGGRAAYVMFNNMSMKTDAARFASVST